MRTITEKTVYFIPIYKIKSSNNIINSMDGRNIELFASSYPKADASRLPPSRTIPGMSRTAIKNIVSDEGFYSVQSVTAPKQSMSTSTKQGMKKFFAILLITLVGALLYSAFAYTISDSIFSKFGVEFFDTNGSPGMAVIAIHSVIFLGVIYLIVNTLRWWNN